MRDYFDAILIGETLEKYVSTILSFRVMKYRLKCNMCAKFENFCVIRMNDTSNSTNVLFKRNKCCSLKRKRGDEDVFKSWKLILIEVDATFRGN